MMLVSPSHGYLTRSQCHAFAATHRNIARESVPRCVRNVCIRDCFARTWHIHTAPDNTEAHNALDRTLGEMYSSLRC